MSKIFRSMRRNRSRLTAGVLGRSLDSIPPVVGAEVMGTAIVSIALSLDGQETLSRVVLAPAAVIWVMLAMLLPLRAARDPAAFRANARTPADSPPPSPRPSSVPG